MEFQNMLDHLRQKSDAIGTSLSPTHLSQILKQEITTLISSLEHTRSPAMVEACMSRFLSGKTMSQALQMSAYSKQDQQMFIENFREGFAPIYRESGCWDHSLSKPRGR